MKKTATAQSATNNKAVATTKTKTVKAAPVEEVTVDQPTEAPAKGKGKNKPTVQEAAPVEKAPVETVIVDDLPVGSVVRYPSSKKPYIISEKNDAGRLLFSETQAFFSKKKNLEMVLIQKGDGKLPASFEDKSLNTLLKAANADLSERQKKAKAKAEKAEANPEQKAETAK